MNSGFELHELNVTNSRFHIHKFKLKLWIHEFKIVNALSWNRECTKLNWNHEFTKFKLWSWKHEFTKPFLWSWNRELVKLKWWIHDIIYVESVNYQKLKLWIYEDEPGHSGSWNVCDLSYLSITLSDQSQNLLMSWMFELKTYSLLMVNKIYNSSSLLMFIIFILSILS
jgi:hypothetical protein